MTYAGIYAPLVVLSAPASASLRASPVPGPLTVTRDLSEFGGDGRISGDVVRYVPPDEPVWRRVRLFTRRDGRLVRETWSDPITGAYSFDYISPDLEYTLVAYDHTGAYQAVISDNPVVDIIP